MIGWGSCRFLGVHLSSSVVLILSSFEYLGCWFGVCEWLCLGFGTRKGKLDSGMKQGWRLILFFNHNDSSDLLLSLSVSSAWNRRDET